MKQTLSYHGAVLAYDIDAQGIVSNAQYLNYLHQARVAIFKAKQIDFFELHNKGYDLVLAHCDIHFKSSLKPHERFYINSSYEFVGKMRLVFQHELFRDHDQQLVTKAIATIACVNTHTGKPCVLKEIFSHEF